MTLWDLIRDFFVENIFGGLKSDGTTKAIGKLGVVSYNGTSGTVGTNLFFVPIKGCTWNGNEIDGITLGDWLSTTFTIITLILLVIVLYIFVKWIFKLFAGLLH